MDEKKTLDEKTLEAVAGGENEEDREYYKALAIFSICNCSSSRKRANSCPYGGNTKKAIKDMVNERCPHKA